MLANEAMDPKRLVLTAFAQEQKRNADAPHKESIGLAPLEPTGSTVERAAVSAAALSMTAGTGCR